MKTLEKHLDWLHNEVDIKTSIDKINDEFIKNPDPEKFHKIVIGEAEGDDHFSDFVKKLKMHVSSS